MPSIEELKQQHTLAHDRAIAAQAAIRQALSHVGDEVAQRVTDLDRANVELARASQAVTNAGGASHHAALPYLATPTSIEMQALLDVVRALPARVASAHSHQLATVHNADHERNYATEQETKRGEGAELARKRQADQDAQTPVTASRRTNSAQSGVQ
jgi:hypothetical protein